MSLLHFGGLQLKEYRREVKDLQQLVDQLRSELRSREYSRSFSSSRGEVRDLACVALAARV
jgi:hypothetical protein